VNHPFNPHVFLKETLLEDDLDVIARGEIPRSVLQKFKRIQRELSRRKKAASSPSPENHSANSSPPNRITPPHPSPTQRKSIPATGRATHHQSVTGGGKQVYNGNAYQNSTFLQGQQGSISQHFQLPGHQNLQKYSNIDGLFEDGTQRGESADHNTSSKLSMIRRQSEPLLPVEINLFAYDEPRRVSHDSAIGYNNYSRLGSIAEVEGSGFPFEAKSLTSGWTPLGGGRQADDNSFLDNILSKLDG